MAVLKKVPPSHFGFCIVGQPNLPVVMAATKHGGGSWNNIVGASRPANGADPNDPAYNWGGLDSFLTFARGKGYAIEYILGYAPLWSNGGQSTQYPPTLLSDYTNWCTAYLTRYANKIAAVEPWNEVSDPTSVTGYAGSLSFLVSMEQSLRTVINAVSPKTLLLTPSTYYGNGLTYHAKYFAAGGGAVCDGLAWHAYPLNIAIKDNYEQFDNTTRFYRALLAQYGKTGCPIWVTEGGYSNSTGDPLAMGALYPLFMSCFATVSMPYAWNRPAGGNTSLDYWLGSAYPNDSNPRGQAYKAMQAILTGANIVQEPQRQALTNLVRNPDGSGSTAGVIGSGGAMPTNWGINAPDSANGVTVQVLGTTTWNGETGFAVRIYGTPTSGAAGSSSFAFESNGQVAALFGQQMSVGAEVAMIAGALDNVGVQLAFNEYTAGGSFLVATMGSSNAPVVPLATPVYWEWAAKVASPTCAYIIPKVGVSYTVGNAFDITLFIKSTRADSGVVWTALLSRDNGWSGLLAWAADGSNPSYSVPGTYPWQRDMTNALGPVQGGVATLGRAPRLFESLPLGGYILHDAPNYPTLLSTYAYKPGWQVAGVDYFVGVSPAKVLKDPATMSIPGAEVDLANHRIVIDNSAPTVTIDGYDFSLAGGWYILNWTCAGNVTIKNCNFAVGSNHQTPINALSGTGNLTILNCTFEGAFDMSTTLSTFISYTGTGTLAVRYTWFKHAVSDVIDINNSAANLIAEYNLFDDTGAAGVHGDLIQFAGVGPYTATIRYNTTKQAAGLSAQGFMVEPDVGATTGVITGGEVAYNTCTGALSYFVGVTVADLTGPFTVHDNYFELASGAFGFTPGGVRGGPGDGNAFSSYANNVNMVDGTTVHD